MQKRLGLTRNDKIQEILKDLIGKGKYRINTVNQSLKKII